ncbi:MAG: DUF1189 family protein [Candidatus Liptonbacteria bacterium]|nr:DUF1189 family protein [Candidatus Liptonbacteria bacterium]
MQFLRTIGESVYSPDFYRALRARPLSFSLKYYYSLAAIVAVVGTAFVSLYLPQAQPQLRAFFENAVNAFPAELAVTFKDGAASANVKEPYFIKYPRALGGASETGGSGAADGKPPEYLLVIDTASPLSIEKFRSYGAAALLAKRDLAVAGRRGEVRVYSLELVPDVTVDKAWVEKTVGQFTPYLKFVGPILVLLFFILILALFTFELVYLFVSALLVWGLLRLKGIKTGYGAAYRTGIHAITLGIFVNIAAMAFQIPLGVPFLFTILMLAVVAVNCRKEGIVSSSSPLSSS